MLAHGQREIVRRVLEQRIPPDIDFMEVDARLEHRQPERLLIRNEVHLVPAGRERDAKLGRDGPGAAVGGVARDANVHRTSSTSVVIASADRGSMRVVRSVGN